MDCCKFCVAPKRHPGCHSTCKEYKIQREELDTLNEKIRKEKNIYFAVNELNSFRTKTRKR